MKIWKDLEVALTEFRGVFTNFSLLILFSGVKCCHLISILCVNRRMSFFAHYLIFLHTLPLTPKFCGFGGDASPVEAGELHNG